MFQRMALVGGLTGAVLGAALWAVVSGSTGSHLGWIAGVAGGMVGYGVAFRRAGRKRKDAAEFVGNLGAAVRLAMIKAALADGEVHGEELEVVREVYAGLTGHELARDELESDMARAESGVGDGLDDLRGLASVLSDQGKSLIIGSAVRVAASDGEFRASEKKEIFGIAEALGVGEDDLQSFLVGSPEERRA